LFRRALPVILTVARDKVMSKKRKENRSPKALNNRLKSQAENYTIVERKADASSENKASGKINLFAKLKANWLVVLVISFLSIGALGAGLKYLEDDAKRELARRESHKGKLLTESEKGKESLLNSINPFLPAPLPNPTPQLSKEYLYAGSKLLAVEDNGATAAAPADLAVWRPSSGVWYVLNGNGTYTIQGWGTNNDDPVEGDYDGDGKTDFAVFRPSTNDWWILKSSDGGYYSVNFGVSGDKPAQADFDGDGKTDIAVFRPSNGTWYISQSGNSQTLTQAFGLSTDIPAPADYDGDGRADIGVWRDSNTTFYSINSSNSQLATTGFGTGGDQPVSSDYDGDGKADYALFRQSNSTWYVRQSTSGNLWQMTWGASGDQLVQNDYDGDGKTDVAVWRPSNGNWYISKSGSNYALRQEVWGTSGDIAVPAYYRR